MMPPRHLSVLPKGPLPHIWLLSDARNDAALAASLAGLPRGCGFIFRHHHVQGAARLARFGQLAKVARARGVWVILAGTVALARRAGAIGAYGAATRLARGGRGLRLITAHSLREIAQAPRARADAIVLSPVWPTRSHPTGATLGALRFRLLAARAKVPVIALGGMTAKRARGLRWGRWGAIDGLSAPIVPPRG